MTKRQLYIVGLCDQHQLVPKLPTRARVSARENMDRGTAGREEEVREESFDKNERKSLRLSSHKFQDSDSFHAHTE